MVGAITLGMVVELGSSTDPPEMVTFCTSTALGMVGNHNNTDPPEMVVSNNSVTSPVITASNNIFGTPTAPP